MHVIDRSSSLKDGKKVVRRATFDNRYEYLKKKIAWLHMSNHKSHISINRQIRDDNSVKCAIGLFDWNGLGAIKSVWRQSNVSLNFTIRLTAGARNYCRIGWQQLISPLVVIVASSDMTNPIMQIQLNWHT